MQGERNLYGTRRVFGVYNLLLRLKSHLLIFIQGSFGTIFTTHHNSGSFSRSELRGACALIWQSARAHTIAYGGIDTPLAIDHISHFKRSIREHNRHPAHHGTMLKVYGPRPKA